MKIAENIYDKPATLCGGKTRLGTVKKEILKVNFFGLGRILEISKASCMATNPNSKTLSDRTIAKGAYSIDVSLWKVVILTVLTPLLIVKYFLSKSPLFEKENKESSLKGIQYEVVDALNLAKNLAS